MNDVGQGVESQALPPSVYVIEDDPAVLQSICWLVRSIGLDAIGYASGEQFLADHCQESPGCVVTDVRMPKVCGLELLKRIRAFECPKPVIMLTGHGDVPMAVRAMRDGAFDFFEKPCNDQIFLDRVQEAVQCDHCNRIRWAAQKSARAKIQKLSERESEVFWLIVDGLVNKEIAVRLGLSIKTVETHRSKICQKLDIDHIAGFVTLANQAGISLEEGMLNRSHPAGSQRKI